MAKVKLNISRVRSKLRESEERSLTSKNVDGEKAVKKPTYDKSGAKTATPKMTDVKAVKKPEDRNSKSPSVPTTKRLGLTNKSAGEPTMKVKSDSEKVPAVGTRDDLKGKVLSGLEKVNTISFKSSAPGKPDSGWGVLGVGKNLSVGQKPENKKVKTSGLLDEGVINGTVRITIGNRDKLVLEAAKPEVVNRIVAGYNAVGQSVKITISENSRRIYANKKFARLMLEAAHAKYHDLNNVRAEKIKRAYSLFLESLKPEFSPYYYTSMKSWISEAVKPAFKQVTRDFKSLYESILSPYEVTVRTKRGRKLEDVLVNVVALDESYAVASAIDHVIAESGMDTNVVHAYVDAKKFLPESATDAFSKSPKFFDDMPKPNGKLPSKQVYGEKDSVNPGKPGSLKPSNKSFTKPLGGLSKGNVGKLTVKAKGGKADNLADRNPKPSNDTKVFKPQLSGGKDNGPIYENHSAYDTMLKIAKDMDDVEDSEFLMNLADKVKGGDDDLTPKESAILDKIIEISMED